MGRAAGSGVNVKVGDTVEKNQTLVTIEAMKMARPGAGACRGGRGGLPIRGI